MEAPRIPSFFKGRRAKQFAYRPFYYDPEKEQREMRRKMIQGELENQTGEFTARGSGIRERWERNSSINRKRSNSNQRLIIIILALLALTWWFYQGLF